MTTASEQKPIIRIKRRRKKGHEGSHGAWKVAYADFVTAMMAFFLLMWLVSITDQDDKERISEYFNPFQEVSDTQEVEVEAGDISMMNGGRAAGAEIHEDQERDATQQTSTSEAIKDSDFDWEMVSIPRVEYERLIENEISQKSIDPDAKRRLDLNDIFGGEARKEAERGEKHQVWQHVTDT